jgi:hypothetical protein
LIQMPPLSFVAAIAWNPAYPASVDAPVNVIVERYAGPPFSVASGKLPDANVCGVDVTVRIVPPPALAPVSVEVIPPTFAVALATAGGAAVSDDVTPPTLAEMD